MTKVENYSVYFSNPYYTNFGKLYKGVIVVVDMDGTEDSRYCHFAIRTKKVKNTIFKMANEKMLSLEFDDVNLSIKCNFENQKKNKSPHQLFFDTDVYEELKKCVPEFMKECGCAFQTEENENGIVLVF